MYLRIFMLFGTYSVCRHLSRLKPLLPLCATVGVGFSREKHLAENASRLCTLLVLFLTMSGVAQAQEWYAFSRHGECFSLAALNERHSLVKGATTPDEMAAMLKQAGIAYTLKPLQTGENGMLRLDVPSTEWSMLLVRKEFCREFPER